MFSKYDFFLVASLFNAGRPAESRLCELFIEFYDRQPWEVRAIAEGEIVYATMKSMPIDNAFFASSTNYD